MLSRMYRERASEVDGAVVWRQVVRRQGAARVLPDGCMDLIWADGALLVAGPDTRAHDVTEWPGTEFVGLRFPPGTGPAVLGVPAHELRDARVPLDALWPGALIRELAEDAVPGRALERIALTRLRAAAPATIDWRGVTDLLRRNVSVPAVAASTGLGERQLHRRCLAAFGYGAKTLGRILRFNHALDLARTGTALATVAATTGYADQAHLARDVRELAGVPMTVLLA